jgi:hypothetical protein
MKHSPGIVQCKIINQILFLSHFYSPLKRSFQKLPEWSNFGSPPAKPVGYLDNLSSQSPNNVRAKEKVIDFSGSID